MIFCHKWRLILLGVDNIDERGVICFSRVLKNTLHGVSSGF